VVSQTSIESFIEILPKIGGRQELVIRALYILGSATNRMISENIKLPINSTTPRVFECRKKGLIELDKVDICLATLQREKLERNANYWKLTKKGMKVLNFKNRQNDNKII